MAQARINLLHHCQDPTNTKLHNAIDQNKTELALSYIKDKDNVGIINVKSLENTPLLLALKKGNILVAEAILNHPDVDVHARDCRGLTALHWACMLRLDKIIEMLVAKGADPHAITKRWAQPDITEPYLMTPYNLYTREVLLFNFIRYYQAEESASQCNDAQDSKKEYHMRPQFESDWWGFRSTFFKQGNVYKEYLPSFIDSAHLHIPGEMAYTDIMFHIKDLCDNLKWKNPNTYFLTSQDEPWSNVRYKRNFFTGIFDFCEYRNAIPINQELLEKMWLLVAPTKAKNQAIKESGQIKSEDSLNVRRNN